MEKLDIRFDTGAVGNKIFQITKACNFSKSKVARAAMNIGLGKLLDIDAQQRIDLIEEFK